MKTKEKRRSPEYRLFGIAMAVGQSTRLPCFYPFRFCTFCFWSFCFYFFGFLCGGKHERRPAKPGLCMVIAPLRRKSQLLFDSKRNQFFLKNYGHMPSFLGWPQSYVNRITRWGLRDWMNGVDDSRAVPTIFIESEAHALRMPRHWSWRIR